MIPVASGRLYRPSQPPEPNEKFQYVVSSDIEYIAKGNVDSDPFLGSVSLQLRSQRQEMLGSH